jgi:predicted nucleic acid-binding protein
VNKREESHPLAAQLLAHLRRNAVIPAPVLVEADHLLRSRISNRTARRFLKAIAGGEREVAYLTPGLLRRAVELDNQYADLNLGFVDTCVMAIAERHELPILTFDFTDFRATQSATGPWPLLLGEDAFQRAIDG